jgi:hypothetical protein
MVPWNSDFSEGILIVPEISFLFQRSLFVPDISHYSSRVLLLFLRSLFVPRELSYSEETLTPAAGLKLVPWYRVNANFLTGTLYIWFLPLNCLTLQNLSEKPIKECVSHIQYCT